MVKCSKCGKELKKYETEHHINYAMYKDKYCFDCYVDFNPKQTREEIRKHFQKVKKKYRDKEKKNKI
jgi:hypothetical protein